MSHKKGFCVDVSRIYTMKERQVSTRLRQVSDLFQTSTSIKLLCTVSNQLCILNAYVCTHVIPLAMSVKTHSVGSIFASIFTISGRGAYAVNFANIVGICFSTFLNSQRF